MKIDIFLPKEVIWIFSETKLENIKLGEIFKFSAD